MGGRVGGGGGGGGGGGRRGHQGSNYVPILRHGFTTIISLSRAILSKSMSITIMPEKSKIVR